MKPGKHQDIINMARTNTARAESIVTLNGKAAESALEALKTKAKEYRKEIDAASKAGDDTKVKKLTAELKSTESAMRSVRQQTFDYNSVLKNLNGSSIRDLEKTAKALKNEIKGLTPATKEFTEKSKQLDLVRGRLDQLNGRVRENQNWLSRAGNTFNKYFGLATAAIASITGMSLALRGASDKAAKMDDIYADVMKTTGLLRKEVVGLNEEFKKLNTRTSREELNQLARDAGKLGISGKEDILAFVTAANKINVALREDLGEDAVLNIGKIAEIFKLTKELGIERAYMSIGSAINAIGQGSSAAEQYLVDFTKRVAGPGYQAGLTLQDILGYASALDQSGAQVEMSATAFQNFLMKMYSETATMAEIANMDLKSFSEMLSKDVNGAIIAVLKGLNSKGGFAQMVPLFKEMGGEGARFVSVLSSLGTNINLVTEAQKLSNVEFEKATSLENEYNIKNNTRQAQLDKAKKAFQDQVIILGEKLSPAFLKSTNAGTLFLKVIIATPAWVYKLIAAGGAAILMYKSWNAVIAVWNTLVVASKAASLLLAAGMATLQGNLVRAAAAMKLFNTTISASAVGVIVTAISALGLGIYKVITYQSTLTKAIKTNTAEVDKAKYAAHQLLDVIKNSASGSSEYQEAIAKLQEQYGPYINSLIDEKGVLTDISGARHKINQAIEKTIGLKVKEQAITDVTNKSIEKQANYYEKMVKVLMKQGKLSEDTARIYATSFADGIRAGGDYSTEINKILSKVNRFFEIIPFRNFAREYSDMVSDISAVNKKFQFIAAANDEVLGPPKPEKLKKEFDENEEIINNRNAALLEANKKAFQVALENLDSEEKRKNNLLKESYMKGLISQEEFHAQSNLDTVTFLARRNALYIQYGQDNEDAEGKYLDAMLAQFQKAQDSVNDIFKKSLAKRKKLANDSADKKARTEEITSSKITPITNTSSEDEARIKRFKDLERQAADIKERYQASSWKKRKAAEQKNLDDMLRKNLISQEEYEYSLKEMKIQNALAIAQSINQIVGAMSDFYNTIKDAEFNKLEQQKEKEIALAGNNADKKAAIEEKYEKEKLALQIEYADKDMAIKIIQAISNGALAVTQAWATLPTPAAIIMTAIIAATNAVQVASIVAQRNALKSNLSSGSGTASKSKVSVKGYSDGGFTDKDPSDNTPVGVVHANEWVAPASMVRSNPLVFASLEKERKKKYSIMSPRSNGFASGGYTTDNNKGGDMNQLFLMILAEIRALKDKPWKGYVLTSEINAVRELEDRIKKQGSL